MDASVPSLISAYEQRIQTLENEKLILQDRIAENTKPKTSFEETLRTALIFLAHPWIIWRSKRFEDKQTVLKLAFADRLRYSRETGLRAANLSFPFKVISALAGGDLEMARLEGETSNALFEVLEDWNHCLKSENLDPIKPDRKRTTQVRRGPSL